jgi:predicted Zn finger-like uncharacterized protein
LRLRAAKADAMAEVPPAPPHSFTRCPACRTVFRVTAQQLAMRSGQVRCGQCKTAFDGRAQLVSLAPEPQTAATPPDDAALGPPTVTLREAHALETPVEPAAAATAGSPAPADNELAADVAYADRFSRARRPRPARAMAALYAMAITLLAVLLGAQALFHYSSAIAAHWPGSAPTLTRLCETVGCAVRPLDDTAMQYLAFDASDLQADPAHKGLLTLTASIRNRAGWTLAYPHLELTLTDAQDQVVVRRALAPADYAGGTVDVARGIAANGEVNLKLFIDASATVQAGYRLYMFYP